jgi:polyphosphate kinase
MAPIGMRTQFLHWIDRERERAQAGERALITAKMNSLVDTRIIEALAAASEAGVQIKLAVRGICCLRPGVKGQTDNIRVVSIVDRFLEHSRLFYFFNGGNEEYYAASADWMPRNLDRRVELMFPVESPEGREKIKTTFDIFFADNVKARVLDPDGTYHFKKRRKNEEPVRCQEELYQRVLSLKDRPRTLQFKAR